MEKLFIFRDDREVSSFVGYHIQYKQAIDILLKSRVSVNDHYDQIATPLLFLIQHTIELSLKVFLLSCKKHANFFGLIEFNTFWDYNNIGTHKLDTLVSHVLDIVRHLEKHNIIKTPIENYLKACVAIFENISNKSYEAFRYPKYQPKGNEDIANTFNFNHVDDDPSIVIDIEKLLDTYHNIESSIYDIIDFLDEYAQNYYDEILPNMIN